MFRTEVEFFKPIVPALDSILVVVDGTVLTLLDSGKQQYNFFFVYA
jgi:hypothetical protein